ncbi:ABC transporter ATP-binding protein [Leptospira levettii]|nr:ABC transporter ATP-binding protein [Leptospira levettii]TGM33455.1 ABC transporter ATP-binding protein [Leptospira levettii]TGM35508.1 ABC transporter ATP-binding protein [Leptospira levettii]TGM65646.1 ABC transporter ATP-binding protein [Leptospira levettii]TGM82636.1 ABC transporter ATP-binding protein [Leptospira levettii]
MSNISKVWFLLDSSQKRRTVYMFVLIFFSLLFESFGIGVIVPLVSVLTDSSQLRENPYFVNVISYLGNPPLETLAVYAMVLMVVLYTVRTIYLIYFTWEQASYAAEFQSKLSRTLFKKYLDQPYLFHVNRNSSELIRNTSTEVAALVSMVQQALSFFNEAITMVGISLFLVYVEPVGAFVVVGSLGLAAGITFALARKKLLTLGLQRQNFEAERIRHFQQGLGGIKDIKIYGREDEFLSRYRKESDGAARVVKQYTTLVAFPRLWLEYFSILGFVLLILTSLSQGKTLSEAATLVALFGAAAFRVMPSINRMLVIMQNIKFSLPTIDLIYQECKLEDSPKEKREQTVKEALLDFHSLTLENLQFSYSSIPVIKNISLEIESGTTIGFIGESGAGKSTLLDLILGLITPDSGDIKVNGNSILKDPNSWQRIIGYVSQNIYLTDDTLKNNIAFGIPDNQIDTNRVNESIQLAQLESFVNKSEFGIETIVGERGVKLSGGQKQRIGIARALYHNPSVLILDEATSSLDLNTESEVMDAINALHGQKTILIIAHRLSTLQSCDKIYRIENGMIFQDHSIHEQRKKI